GKLPAGDGGGRGRGRGRAVGAAIAAVPCAVETASHGGDCNRWTGAGVRAGRVADHGRAVRTGARAAVFEFRPDGVSERRGAGGERGPAAKESKRGAGGGGI